MRRDAVIKLGQEQNPEYLPYFEARLQTETHPEVIHVLNEAIAITHTVNRDPAIQNAAIKKLGDLRSINALSFLKEIEKAARANPGKYSVETAKVLSTSIVQIEAHLRWGNLVGTGFRGLSTASVLLIAALGLAITFGLMGVINMAHGEVMAVGSYTTYMVQGVFGSGLLFSLFGKVNCHQGHWADRRRL
jgi:urea transport system permease protein